MQRAIILFAVVVITLIWAAHLAVYAVTANKEEPSALTAVPAGVAMLLPFIMAYVAHRVSGARGNPFRGLQFGGGGAIVLAWAIGIITAVAGTVLTILLGAAVFDTAMTDYIAMMEDQAKQAGGGEMDSSTSGVFRIIGYVTVFAGPTIGAMFWGLLFSLITLPWYGWFARRLLAYGRQSATIILLTVFTLQGMAGGLLEGPQWDQLTLAQRMIVVLASNLASFPIMWWLFLRFKSAVVPAVFLGTFVGTMQGASAILSDANQFLAPPTGLLVSAATLFTGIALWVWKDPGGTDLAVASVAADGTPLSPEDLREMAEHDSQRRQPSGHTEAS